ncbi:hypothetical protein B0T22DRAFT_514056 [Podospora appendiculata]|uniref:Heterokaryon incompatibility domain-containing protein n=1 Tax=Podospora appendiculata TaxID=314037 RepID=A0AAE0XBG9_9PEZI|nr:hypothetical protein B0T22DRAFT_514056 [Podospora appendiculata]
MATTFPKYAILSHTWGKAEATFQDWQSLESAATKTGFAKIEGACRQAIRDGLGYVWADTNCIDKSSSSELSEAINSIPLASLQDPGSLTSPEQRRRLFQDSRWFERGWTLQELLAPGRCFFYGAAWNFLGTKDTLARFICEATGIESKFILGTAPIGSASISKRMSWVSKRRTTRAEDIAYCMLGIFNINLPMLYGEGARPFLRLQEELIRISADQTIFCWEWGRAVPASWGSILAPSPAEFANCGGFLPKLSSFAGEITPYALTNIGMTITLPYLQTSTRGICGILNVVHENSDLTRPTFLSFHRISDGDLLQRFHLPKTPFQMGDGMKLDVLPPKGFNIRARQSDGVSAPIVVVPKTSPDSSHGFLLLSDTVTYTGHRYANAHIVDYASKMPMLHFVPSPSQDFYAVMLHDFKDTSGQPVVATIILALRT